MEKALTTCFFLSSRCYGYLPAIRAAIIATCSSKARIVGAEPYDAGTIESLHRRGFLIGRHGLALKRGGESDEESGEEGTRCKHCLSGCLGG